MPRHLDDIAKNRIICRIEDGWSIRQIAVHMNVSKNTVSRVKKRWEQEGSISRKAGSSRPRVSNNEEDAVLVDHLRLNPFDCASLAKVATNFPGSRSTACRRIKSSDLRNQVAAKKQLLTEEKKQSRVIFALNYIYRDIAFWKKVIFTDEKVFQSTYDGHIRVYRPRNTRFEEAYVSGNRRSGRFSVNVWAWISYNGMGICWKIDGRFVSQNYIRILENVMMPSVEQLYPNNDFVFQQDNCPVHTANIVKTWFQNNNIETLPWVANSPDINPVENLWGFITKTIYKRNFQPQNSDELWHTIENIWEELATNEDYVKKLILSVPQRLNEVIVRDGSMTKY